VNSGALPAWGGAGNLTDTLTLTANPDTTVEPNESFSVLVYSTAPGTIFGPGNPYYQGTNVITLLNDDAGAPVFSSPTAFSLAENTTAAGTAAATGGGTVVYSLTSVGAGPGVDDALFTINAATGAITFVAPPNFEAPGDAGANNVYNIQVNAHAGGLDTTQNLAITVTNADDLPPVITSGALVSIPENTQAVQTETATTDAASTATSWSISGGADAAAFTIDPVTGALAFASKPNFEAGTGHGGTLNDYLVQVKATDSGGLPITQNMTVSVTDVVEGPVITSNGGAGTVIIHIPENTLTATTVVTEAATKDDQGTSATFSLSGPDSDGSNPSGLHIDPATGIITFAASPNFEAPADANGDNVYQVTVTADTGHGPDGTQTLFVFVDNVVEPGDPPLPSGGGGGGGAQTITGTGGDESFAGGIGNNIIDGGAGNDSIDGNTGSDSLQGGDGNDVIRGMDGNDTVDGGAGNDDVNGNQGDDLVSGGDGADTVRGGQGNDTVSGGAGDDPHVNGNLGNDIVHGDDGNDTVYGGQGNDTIYGDAGNDRLSGDLGNDILFGGPGADQFAFAPGGGQDWVGDFNAAEGDKILLPVGTAYTVTSYLGQVVISLGNGDQIGLAGIPSASFTTDWIIFG
jgi:Ca2+-binding RTX toxin-like protein